MAGASKSLPFFGERGLNAGVLLARLDALRRSNFSAARDGIIAEWGPSGKNLLPLGDQVLDSFKSIRLAADS